MKTDRELLELAAKAAGMVLGWIGDGAHDCTNLKKGSPIYKGPLWAPLHDDGDALRLAVKLNILNTRSTGYEWPVAELFVEHDDDPYAATRRAIVRAAAAIGESM